MATVRLPSMRTIGALLVIACVTSTVLLAADAPNSTLRFTARSQPEKGGKFVTNNRPVEWDAKETAVLIIDMWDKHWCDGATRRSTEFAPRINQLAKTIREKGGLVVHAPSDCMKFYEGTPQRELAKSASKAAPPTPLKGWRYLDLTCEAKLPIDDSDGGCDCQPQCAQPKNKQYPWKQQNPLIEIAPGDAVSQDGQELFNLYKQRGVKRVIVCGVHLNMCVLGRTFAIRQLTEWGFDVVLVRDLTDTMYNPRMAPNVPHEKGTELVISHVEKYWCPTTTSEQLIDGKSK
jgi:nicotinamidase-related amidase